MLNCRDQGWDFLSVRVWIGMWSSAILMVMVAFDLSALVKYITRFTEESFAVLISLIFVFEAFAKTAGISTTHPVHTGTAGMDPAYGCHCQYSNATQHTTTPATATEALENILSERTGGCALFISQCLNFKFPLLILPRTAKMQYPSTCIVNICH